MIKGCECFLDITLTSTLTLRPASGSGKVWTKFRLMLMRQVLGPAILDIILDLRSDALSPKSCRQRPSRDEAATALPVL